MRYKPVCLIVVSMCCIYGLFTIYRATPSGDVSPPVTPSGDVSPPASPVGTRPIDRNLVESTMYKIADRTVRRNVTHSSDEQCKQRLPQSIIIGMAKSGTTTLITFLNYHPQIAVSFELPEKNFFSNEYEKGLNWYRRQMACSYSNQVTMEKTSGYFPWHECPKRIHEMDRDVKLLLIVKDPITRIVSCYLKLLNKIDKRQGTDYHSIEEMMIDPNTGELRLEQPPFLYSNYSYFLRNWFAYFSMEQIHVVDGHAFENNPASQLRGVEKYLGIKPFFQEDQFVYNSTKGKYCFKRDQKIECMRESKGKRHPKLSPELLKQLKDIYHPINEEFYRMIGQRLNWGY